jgi:predicted small lipoprotein YifL
MAAFFAMLAASWLLLNGCGQKGPPRPPRRPLPPAIKDLAFTNREGRVELTWTVADTADRDDSAPVVVKIFRARVAGEEVDCENCSVRYTAAGEIPIPKKRSERSEPIRMRYTEFVEPGYRYFFKVIAYDEYGIGSNDSNVVQFDH